VCGIVSLDYVNFRQKDKMAFITFERRVILLVGLSQNKNGETPESSMSDNGQHTPVNTDRQNRTLKPIIMKTAT